MLWTVLVLRDLDPDASKLLDLVGLREFASESEDETEEDLISLTYIRRCHF